jgi:hypothetical protein
MKRFMRSVFGMAAFLALGACEKDRTGLPW